MPLAKLVYRDTVRATVEAVAIGSIALGVSLAVGGPARFVAPAFATARTVPGSQWTWAALITAAGLTTLIGARLGWRRHVVMAGLAGQGLVYLFLDISLWVTAAQDPTTPLTGGVIYGMVAFICAILYGGGHGLIAAENAEENPPP